MKFVADASIFARGDGEVHPSDVLTPPLQHAAAPGSSWIQSVGPLGNDLNMYDAGGVPAAEQVALQKVLEGTLPNHDTYVQSSEYQ